MSWTSSPKDSPIGLTVLLVLGSMLTVPLIVAGVRLMTTNDVDPSPGEALLGVVVACLGLYTTVYAVNGLIRRLRSYSDRRSGPPVAARLEVATVVLAYVALVTGVLGLVPWTAVAAALVVAVVSSLSAMLVRRRLAVR